MHKKDIGKHLESNFTLKCCHYWMKFFSRNSLEEDSSFPAGLKLNYYQHNNQNFTVTSYNILKLSPLLFLR